MKWDNTDLRVGLMVFGALVLAVVSFMWVGRVWGRDVAPLYTDVPVVEGLGAESPVILNGFNVGRVSSVTPRVDSTGKLVFRVRLDVVWRLEDGSAMPFVEGMRARVVPPTLDIGRGQVVLEMPRDASVERVALKPGDVLPSLQLTGSTTNRMQLVVDSVGRDLRLAIASVEKLVQSMEVTVASATATMRSANAVIASVNKELPGIVGGVQTTLASADSLLRGLRGLRGGSTSAPAPARHFNFIHLPSP